MRSCPNWRSLVANGPAAVAAKSVTATIPIVFFSAGDPVARGLVTSLNRPGGNLTGISTLQLEVAAKRLELLHEMMPSAYPFAVLINPTNPTLMERLTVEVQEAARVLRRRLLLLRAATKGDFDTVFAELAKLQPIALSIGDDAFYVSHTEQLAAMTLRNAVPAIFQNREFPAAGGLISDGSSDTDAFSRMGNYAGRILDGEKPGDLPVQQATKFELIINLKTAKALGLALPATVLARADEVIE